jgi:hypothetical protein
MPDKLVMDYVIEERHRCMDLCEAIHHDAPFLIYCIDNSYMADELTHARRRFEEMQPVEPEPEPVTDEDVDDLL